MLNPNFARATGVARTLPKSVLRPRGTVRPSASAPWQRRMASQMGYPRRGPRYESYARVQTLRMLWRSSPVFRYSLLGVGGLGGVYYVQHIEEVPITGRRRFNILSGDDEEQMAVSMYQQTLQQYRGQLLSAHHPATRMVRRVLDRLIPASGLADAEWEVHVILDPEQKNAFVMPGGKVFVFSGILPICDGDDGLAAVLGHEIAHNVAHHAAERMSRMTLLAVCLYPVALLLGAPDFLSQIVLDFGFVRPASRTQEAEVSDVLLRTIQRLLTALKADYIGLLMMAESCFDPEAAVGLSSSYPFYLYPADLRGWQRMQKAEEYAPPQWMSTHPSSANRVEKIREWLPEAEDRLASSNCGPTHRLAHDFKKTFNDGIW